MNKNLIIHDAKNGDGEKGKNVIGASAWENTSSSNVRNIPNNHLIDGNLEENKIDLFSRIIYILTWSGCIFNRDMGLFIIYNILGLNKCTSVLRSQLDRSVNQAIKENSEHHYHQFNIFRFYYFLCHVKQCFSVLFSSTLTSLSNK
jgi:hypothetical protein